jgi:hypothetical protein
MNAIELFQKLQDGTRDSHFLNAMFILHRHGKIHRPNKPCPFCVCPAIFQEVNTEYLAQQTKCENETRLQQSDDDRITAYLLDNSRLTLNVAMRNQSNSVAVQLYLCFCTQVKDLSVAESSILFDLLMAIFGEDMNDIKWSTKYGESKKFQKVEAMWQKIMKQAFPDDEPPVLETGNIINYYVQDGTAFIEKETDGTRLTLIKCIIGHNGEILQTNP